MSRTVNRPGMNITAPTLPAPEAMERGYGLKVARAVTRYAHQFQAMREHGSVAASVIETRDQYTLMAAGLISRSGQHRERIVLTVEGGLLAKAMEPVKFPGQNPAYREQPEQD